MIGFNEAELSEGNITFSFSLEQAPNNKTIRKTNKLFFI